MSAVENALSIDINVIAPVNDGDVVTIKILSLPDAAWGALKTPTATVLNVGSTLTAGTTAMKFGRLMNKMNDVCRLF